MIWKKLVLEPNTSYVWKAGRQQVYLQKRNKEWMLGICQSETAESGVVLGQSATPSEMPVWSSYTGDGGNELLVLPALPELPVVVRPIAPFQVLPGQTAVLYPDIPLTLQFYAGSRKKEHLIAEINSERLSQTWFGEPDEGLLAYVRYINFADAFQPPEQAEHHIVCPVRISNETQHVLPVERLLLHVDYLTVYTSESTLFTNEIRIKYHGEGQVSDVLYASQPPAVAKKAQQVNAPRSQRTHNVISRSFHIIKSLTQY